MTKDKQQLLELIEKLRRNSGWRNQSLQCVTDPALLEKAAEAIQSLMVENERRGDMIERLIEVIEFCYQHGEQPREIAEARTLLGDS